MKTFVKYLFIAFFLLFSTNGFAQKSLTDFIDGMKNSSNPEQFVPQIKKELKQNYAAKETRGKMSFARRGFAE